MSQVSRLATPLIVARLREATRAAHDSIQTVPSLERLLSADLTRAGYVRTLQGLEAFRAALAPMLVPYLQGFAGAEVLLEGSMLDALKDDLAWFGAALLAPPRLLAPTSLASALGVLYVVEGSNLGGRVIGRHVSVALDVGVGAGGSFFCGLSAEQARRRWQVLVDTLHDTIDPTGAAQEPVIDAALATFAALGAWMRTVDTVDG